MDVKLHDHSALFGVSMAPWLVNLCLIMMFIGLMLLCIYLICWYFKGMVFKKLAIICSVGVALIGSFTIYAYESYMPTEQYIGVVDDTYTVRTVLDKSPQPNYKLVSLDGNYYLISDAWLKQHHVKEGDSIHVKIDDLEVNDYKHPDRRVVTRKGRMQCNNHPDSRWIQGDVVPAFCQLDPDMLKKEMVK